MRINKYLASCGEGSRRGVEALVTDGRVRVNGRQVTDLSFDVNLEKDKVMVDSRQISHFPEILYFILNKPKGVVTTVKDDKGRKTVMDFVPKIYQNIIFPVGRLDYDSEGLLILTNDGELTQKLTHPSGKIAKTYIARIEGTLDVKQIEQLSKGVVIDGKKTLPAKVRLIDFRDNNSRLEVTIIEGRNRQIRKMFEVVGKEITLLKRVQIGNLRLGGMGRGEIKQISRTEVLKALINE